MTNIIEKLDSWRRPVSKKDLVYAPNFSVSVSMYSSQGVSEKSLQSPLPKSILKNETLTPYGFVLEVLKKEKTVECAFLGFNITDKVADCYQIQGGNRMYGVLTPVLWDSFLLNQLVEFSSEIGLEMVRVIPYHRVEGNDHKNLERLLKRYDINAKTNGFRYSTSDDKWYVKELKK